MMQAGSRDATVQIGDRSLRMCFSIMGIVALRDHWKLEDDSEVLARLDAIARNFQKGKVDFRLAAEIIWAGLQEHHAGEFTPADVLKLLSAAGIENAPAIMERAFQTLIAASPPKEARPPGPTKNRAG